MSKPQLKDLRTTGAVRAQHRRVSIRVASNGYVTALLPSAFFAGFAFYLGFDSVALILALLAGLMPLLAAFDRIVVENGRIYRSGFLPKMWGAIRGTSAELQLSDVEQVETQALRALRRGGQIYYRYRTTVVGDGRRFVFHPADAGIGRWSA